jgi:nucleoside-diphosphate-sugar epimerase
MCRHFREDYGLQTRIARYHNVYGPHGTYDGGREKAPAAICRKVIAAKLSGADENRGLGRRQPDPQLHVYRRLYDRHPYEEWKSRI